MCFFANSSRNKLVRFALQMVNDEMSKLPPRKGKKKAKRDGNYSVGE